MKNIVAKLNCTHVQPLEGGGESVRLEAVTTGSKENETFARFTPAATVSMSITNPDAVGSFEVGKSYKARFEEAAE